MNNIHCNIYIKYHPFSYDIAKIKCLLLFNPVFWKVIHAGLFTKIFRITINITKTKWKLLFSLKIFFCIWVDTDAHGWQRNDCKNIPCIILYVCISTQNNKRQAIKDRIYKIGSRHWKCPLVWSQMHFHCPPHNYSLRQVISFKASKCSPVFTLSHPKKHFLL